MTITSKAFKEKVKQMPVKGEYAGEARLCSFIYRRLQQLEGKKGAPLYSKTQIRKMLSEIESKEDSDTYLLYTLLENWLVSSFNTAKYTKFLICAELDYYNEVLNTALLTESMRSVKTNELPENSFIWLQKIGVERFVADDADMTKRFYDLAPFYRVLKAYNEAIKAIGCEVGRHEMECLCFDFEGFESRIDGINERLDAIRSCVSSSAYYNDNEEMREALLELIDTLLPKMDLKAIEEKASPVPEKMESFKEKIRGLALFAKETGQILAWLSAEEAEGGN